MKVKESAVISMLTRELSYASKLKKEADITRNESEIMYANGYYDGLYKFMQKTFNR